ncbi:MAG: SsrA-binding protein SmpB [Bacteroidia bacterium]|nr:SsrA-binding protein SmpB [Bacteroidia bacterium]NNC85316.1 SsrA-binding protein SmpB [Bacteroidia bacterium]NNM16527.1 SsrA-binding protein SmpB [Bacteroidia bacterium]
MSDKKEINIANNRKANYSFQLEETFTAGMSLKGSEIKSIRDSQVTMSDAYCVFIKGELWVKGLHIAEYKQASYNNHEPKRDRKLLLNKRELKKLLTKVKEKGYSIVPTRLFISERGKAKLDIALAKGKKMYDKRHDIKRKDLEREIQRRVK